MQFEKLRRIHIALMGCMRHRYPIDVLLNILRKRGCRSAFYIYSGKQFHFSFGSLRTRCNISLTVIGNVTVLTTCRFTFAVVSLVTLSSSQNTGRLIQTEMLVQIAIDQIRELLYNLLLIITRGLSSSLSLHIKE